MKKLLNLADEYLRCSSWKDLALVKLCTAGFGFLLGLTIPKKSKAVSSVIALVIFLSTLVPIMMKLLTLISSADNNHETD